MGGQRFVRNSGAEFVKVGTDLGLVFGFAAVCTEDGKPYFDKGSMLSAYPEHLPEEAMLKASAELMQGERVTTDMHARDAAGDPVTDGSVVFAFPLTAEIAKRLGIVTKRTGLLVGLKPSPEVYAKFKDGDRMGFSIGGQYLELEEVEIDG